VVLPTPGLGVRGFLRVGEDGRSLADRLAASGFDVYLPAMRANAPSPTWEPWHDVRAVLDEVARHDVRAPWLVGHGFAGWWAVAEAARGATPCAGVALLGTPAAAPTMPLSTRVGLRALATWGRPVPTPHLTRLWAVADGRPDGAAWRALLTEDAEPVPSVWVAELGRWLEHGRPCVERGRWDLGLAARAIRVPLVAVDAKRDPSVAQGGRWATWWGGPVEVLEHAPNLDLASLLVDAHAGDALVGALARAATGANLRP
jgi:pimeloyl-ACP methyl ester carboxylesterase